MAQFRYELATAEDDAELRQILAETPMPGLVSVTYRREPSYFSAAAVSGGFHQVLMCRDSEAGRAAGFVSRTARLMYVNGSPVPIGTLSTLRTLPEYRNRGLLARGIVHLKKLHADGRAKLYLISIAIGNDNAMQILTSRRTGLPTLYPHGKFLAFAIPIPQRRQRSQFTSGDVSLVEATADDLPEIIEFLNIHGPRRQFFPVYCERDFFHDEATFKDLKPEDILLARRSGRLIGLLGAWDQHGFKQSIVEGYGPGLRWVSPMYNFWARVRGRPGIPQTGAELRYLSAAMPLVADDNPHVFLLLVRAALARASAGEHQYLMLGMHERDPLFPAARRMGGRTYPGQLYLACWNDGEVLRQQVDDRPPYMELGSM